MRGGQKWVLGQHSNAAQPNLAPFMDQELMSSMLKLLQ